MASSSDRADALVVSQGLAPTRAKAQALIMAGLVYRGDTQVLKAGQRLPVSATLRLKGAVSPYVSRGGLKLERALRELSPPISGRVFADFGASTGGFTDCLLRSGAVRVYAIDVGYGQLADVLRQDGRVIVMERTNARHLTAESLPECVDGVVIDASFISLRLLLPAAAAVLAPGGFVLAMAKPQFEAGPERVGRGVVHDEHVRQTILAEVRHAACDDGWRILGECAAGIPGPKGNREHFFWLERDTEKGRI